MTATNTETPKRVYCTGEKPVSPIVKNDMIYVLSDIREEESMEHGFGDTVETAEAAETVKNWSYLQEEMTPTEYFAWAKELQDETNWEQDAAIFELAAMMAGGA